MVARNLRRQRTVGNSSSQQNLRQLKKPRRKRWHQQDRKCANTTPSIRKILNKSKPIYWKNENKGKWKKWKTQRKHSSSDTTAMKKINKISLNRFRKKLKIWKLRNISIMTRFSKKGKSFSVRGRILRFLSLSMKLRKSRSLKIWLWFRWFLEKVYASMINSRMLKTWTC